MTKKENKALAEKIVDKFAEYQKIQAVDDSKEYKLKEGQTIDDIVYDMVDQHVCRVDAAGYMLVGTGSDKKAARSQVVDALASEMDQGNLVLSDTWAEDNL